MSRDLTHDERLEIERLMDAAGIAAVLSATASICDEKAEHVSVNWQDAPLGKRWAKLGGQDRRHCHPCGGVVTWRA